MKTIFQNSIKKGLNYSKYRQIIADLLTQNLSTGNTQTEDLLHYSNLNVTRMNRLDKTIEILPEIKKEIEKLPKQTWLVLSEGWCGDAAQIVPVIVKMADCSENIDLKIVLRDENEELMNEFLTNGGKAIPKLIVIDDNLNLINHWGPRPEPAKKLIADYKAKTGVVDEPIKIELQKWYLNDKGHTIQNEIVELLK